MKATGDSKASPSTSSGPDFLIIGQGICGTMLSWFLHREGKSFAVIDNNNENSASKIAAGIINPITGRRYVTTWMIDEVMPFAIQTYRELEIYLNTDLVSEKSIIDFFPSPQMRNAFVERITEDDTYIHSYPDQNHFNQYFNYDFGCGEIRPAYTIHLQSLLNAWRQRLAALNLLIEQQFDATELKISNDGINYQNITAKKIIFCDGVAAVNSPWFSLLPFAPNKGEAMIIECEELSNQHIFKKGMMLTPLPEPNMYWIGSNYQWEFKDDQPSEQFYKQTTTLLKHWLKAPFRVLQHKAAVRPATIERRPFVGFHPLYPNIGILNGMGTKGTSLAPFFANQLVQQLVHDLPVYPEANVHRFSRILSK
ncbi:MAG: NAD(P)/FAD-dependent oxidoreductase [Flavisolibacter sp.]